MKTEEVHSITAATDAINFNDPNLSTFLQSDHATVGILVYHIRQDILTLW